MPLLFHVICFLYNAALLAEEDAKSQKADFFSWLKFAIWKGRQIKTIIVYTWPSVIINVWAYGG